MKRKHPANLFVRDCITTALFNLMKKKDYREITISEIVKTAGVSRNSFYRNYQSIEDIIRQHMTERTEKWWAEYMANLHPHVIEETFQHFLDMKELIQLLYKANLSYLLMEHIFICGKQSLTGELHNTYQTAFTSGGLWGLTNEWVIRGMKESPKEMEALFRMQGQQSNKT